MLASTPVSNTNTFVGSSASTSFPLSKADKSTPVAHTQDPTPLSAPPSPKVAVEQPQARQSCLSLIQEGLPFGDLSTRLWRDVILSPSSSPNTPNTHSPRQQTIQEKIETFQQTQWTDSQGNSKSYADIIKTLNKTPWKEHIATLKEGSPEWNACAKFRAEAVELQNELSVMAANMMGMEHFHYSRDKKDKENLEKNSWNAFGTPGNRSDIDNTLRSPNASEEDRMLVKIFADTFYTYLFGSESLSGIQLDTETYIEHPGIAQKTEPKLLLDASKGNLYYLELTMAQLEMRRAYGDDERGCEEWEKYKERCMQFFHNPNDPFRISLQKIFSDVETFHAQVQADILKEMIKENSLASDEIADCQAQLQTNGLSQNNVQKLHKFVKEAMPRGKDFNTAYKQAAMAYKCNRLINLSKNMDEDREELANLAKLVLESGDQPTHQQKAKMDLLNIGLAAKALLRNTFFDESYSTAGAYNIVCERNRGQLSQREYERNMQRLEEDRMSMTLTTRTMIRQVRSSGTALEYLISTNENSAKFHHVAFPHSKGTKSDIDLAIDSGKYAERITSSSIEVLKMMDQKLNPTFKAAPKQYLKNIIFKKKEVEREYEQLYQEVSDLHKITSGLEKCKRQIEINDATAEAVLKENLIPKKLSHKEKLEREANIDKVLSMFKRDGRYFNEELSATDKYNFFILELYKHGCIPDEPIQPPKPPELKYSISEIIKAMPPTIEELGLQTKEEYDNIMNMLNELEEMDPEHIRIGKNEDFIIDGRLPPSAESGRDVLIKFATLILQNEHPEKQPSAKDVALYIIQKLKKVLEDAKANHVDPMQALYKMVKELQKENEKEKKKLDFKKPIPMLSSGNPEVDAIVQARVGLPKVGNVDVEALHTRSRSIAMMKKLKLISTEDTEDVHGDVQKYFKRVEELSNKILKLAQKVDLVPPPTQQKDPVLENEFLDDYPNLIAIWEKANPNTEPIHS